MLKFDAKTWSRLYRLAQPFFVSEVRYAAWGLVVVLTALTLLINYLNVQISFLSRDFMTALNLKEDQEFTRRLLYLLGAFAVATPVIVMKAFTEEYFGLMWRRWLNHEVIKRYFENRAYYSVNSVEGIDNPDQRISEDIRTFTALSISFSMILFNSVIQFSSFIKILWDITPNLVLGVIAYAFFGSLTTYLLGKPLITLNFKQLQKEADYRYKLIHVRENAESIAFLGGDKKEATRVRQRLKAALKNFRQIISWNRNLAFFTTGYNNLTPVLPTIIVAPLYLQGKIEFGVVVQAGIAFGFVLGALSILVAHFSNLSNFAAHITRLGTLWEALDAAARSNVLRAGNSPSDTIRHAIEPKIAFSNVTLYTPNRERMLIHDLSFELTAGSLLVVGPSGYGKSSLLRALSGLWSAGSGLILHPAAEHVMFLPQRPYLAPGTFRSQLLYGHTKRGLTDAWLEALLEQVGLKTTLERVGGFSSELSWANILSSGEQQMVAFARLLVARPSYAFLDEATTALDAETERRLYSQLKEFTTTIISIGYRSTLAQYHDQILELRGGGEWKLERRTP